MAKGVSSAAVQAEQLKLDGNLYFKKNRLGAAIDAYTEAITLCPNVPIYWTNRALCHRKRNDWTRVEEDCLKAVLLDHKSVKAGFLGLEKDLSPDRDEPRISMETTSLPFWVGGHYMLGLALLQRESYAEGIKALEKALDLGRGAHPNGYMVEEIWQELARAKYQEWERDSTKRSWDLQKLKESCEIALKEKHLRDVSQMEGITDSISKQLAALKLVFSKAVEADTPTEVPDYLCCKITLDIFRDPVITPSGLTYERSVLLDHLQKVGNFDPITRDALFPSQLVPNLAIKEAVEAFLEKHGWAYKME